MLLKHIFETLQMVQIGTEHLAVYQNPTIEELTEKNMLYSLRGIADHDGNTYWWNGRKAIHFQVGRILKIDMDSSYFNSKGVARLEMMKLTFSINVISGWQTAIESSSFRKLTSTGEIKIKYGSNIYTFNEYLDVVRKYGNYLS